MEPKERLAAVQAIAAFLLPQSEREVDMTLKAAGSEEVTPGGWGGRDEGKRRDEILRLLSGLTDPVLESLLQMLPAHKRMPESAPPTVISTPDALTGAEAVRPVPQLDEVSPAKAIGVLGPGDKRSVFLVHGRDERAAKEMRTFLRALGLNVIEWESAVSETGQAAPYMGDVILAGMRMADAALVLLTPDDLVRLRPDLLLSNDPADEREIRGQARADVIYEAGMADALDRSRTVLVELGGVKSLSDLGGRNVVRFDGGSRSRNKLANRLESAGLNPIRRGEDWLEVGDFDAAIEAALHDASLSTSSISYVPAQSAKPRVFVGSSSECGGHAEATKKVLEENRTLSVTYWKDLFWTAGALTAIEVLTKAADEQFDFAVFVLSADDVRTLRGESAKVPRDNVIFEMGLFIGALGRSCVFLITPDTREAKLPGDMGGVNVETWVTDQPNTDSAVRSTANTFREMMETMWREKSMIHDSPGGRLAKS